MADEREYDVFLSYSHKDRVWVAEFAEALSQAGVRTWFDKAAISLGERWQERLQHALRTSRTLILIVSSQSVEGPWTFFELGAAIADEKRIIPIVIGDVELTKIPMLLRRYQFLEESSPREAALRVAQVIGPDNDNAPGSSSRPALSA